MEEATQFVKETHGSWLQEHFVSILSWSIVLAILLVIFFKKREQIIQYVRETLVELSKCSWPWDTSLPPSKRYQELIYSTLVVLIGMILLGAYTSIFDYLFGSGIRWLMSL